MSELKINPGVAPVITVYAIDATPIVVRMETLHTRIRRLEWMLQERVAGIRSDSR
jgi:hypothetical protein